jgi:hypothetical protein
MFPASLRDNPLPSVSSINALVKLGQVVAQQVGAGNAYTQVTIQWPASALKETVGDVQSLLQLAIRAKLGA